MFSIEEIKKYYNELNQIDRDKIGYLEANLKIPKKLEKREKEVQFIIDNLESEQLLNNARNIITKYKERYGKI